MKKSKNNTSNRKQDHIKICLEDDVQFKTKTTGFEKYDFEHYAITELTIDEIDLSTDFFDKKISYPFLISCMTGGTIEAESINTKLAEAAQELNIPIGVGSQRQLLEDDKYLSSFKVINEKAGSVPKLGNIGAAEFSQFDKPDEKINYLAESINASAMVIHVNPLQELFQLEGTPNFKGLLKNLEIVCNQSSIPIIIKEVGSGISRKAAKNLLDCGVKGIDVAGAGGTSWSAVEMKRNSDSQNEYFWDWGLPTAYCIKELSQLKKDYDFLLIGSGGISKPEDAAKALALGADISASAGILLKEVAVNGVEGVIKLLLNWFDTIKKIMYLTNCSSIEELEKTNLIKKEEME
jgi:isopentenyl-diphosphate delta-isomerase